MWWYPHCSPRCINFTRYTISFSRNRTRQGYSPEGSYQECLFFSFLNFVYILYQKFFEKSNFFGDLRLSEAPSVFPLCQTCGYLFVGDPRQCRPVFCTLRGCYPSHRRRWGHTPELQIVFATTILTKLCGFLPPICYSMRHITQHPQP